MDVLDCGIEAAASSLTRRVFDLVVTVLLLPAALLVAVPIAIAVAIDSPGPILYRSERVGRGGIPFEMLKFRTMRHLSIGPPVTVHGDERQTPFGRFLASLRLDELPQLWNVLKGDMRLVGPRPEVEQFVRDEAEGYRRILTVRPGLTGPTQLAYAGETAMLASAADRELVYRTDILPDKVRLDLEYVESSTLLGDVRVIALTCVLPLLRAGRALSADGRGARGVAAVVAAAGPVAVFGLFAVGAGGAPW
jgi:lipopolysaccharide/colanic/teichoic acid biosynthesis glycosyltransferase